jgi:hypothetical protein
MARRRKSCGSRSITARISTARARARARSSAISAGFRAAKPAWASCRASRLLKASTADGWDDILSWARRPEETQASTTATRTKVAPLSPRITAESRGRKTRGLAIAALRPIARPGTGKEKSRNEASQSKATRNRPKAALRRTVRSENGGALPRRRHRSATAAPVRRSASQRKRYWPEPISKTAQPASARRNFTPGTRAGSLPPSLTLAGSWAGT